jgi:hypothetical protein
VNGYDVLLFAGIGVVTVVAVGLDRWFRRTGAVSRVRLAAATVSGGLVAFALVLRLLPLTLASQGAVIALGLVWIFMVCWPARFGKAANTLLGSGDIRRR